MVSMNVIVGLLRKHIGILSKAGRPPGTDRSKNIANAHTLHITKITTSLSTIVPLRPLL